jgi:RNA polymerase sigma factor (sigma-70 family)
MTKAPTGPILKLIRRMGEDHRLKQLTDSELLRRFNSEGDEAAFHGLVYRHGGMVLDVCRNVLRNEADAEDAFQATFLILTKKAGSIRNQGSVASWLYGVAYRTALKAHADSARRQKREGGTPAQPPSDPCDDLAWREVRHALHEELNRLSECYRAPLVLCYLQGKTQNEAATLLGVSRATMQKRLEQGRALLRVRLVRRGLGTVAILLAAAWPVGNATAHVPKLLASSTINAAKIFAAGKATAAGVISAKVATLTQGVLKTMFLTKLKSAAAALAVSFIAAGLLLVGMKVLPETVGAQQTKDKPRSLTTGAKDGTGATRMHNGVQVVRPDKNKVAWSVAYCNEGKAVAAVLGGKGNKDESGSVVLWDIHEGKVKKTLEEFDKNSFVFESVCASRDGKVIAASANPTDRPGGIIKVWEANTGDLLGTFQMSGGVHWGVALSHDGKKVVAGEAGAGSHGELCVWDVKSGELVKKLRSKGMNHWVTALSQDGKWVVGGGDEPNSQFASNLVVWDFETGKVKHDLSDVARQSDLGSLRAIAISPDGKLLATGGVGGNGIMLSDMETGKRKHLLKADMKEASEEPRFILSLAFSPDGKLLASAGADGAVTLWDVDKGERRVMLEGHGKDENGRDIELPKGKKIVTSVWFAPDGRTLASAGVDGTIRFWSVPDAKNRAKK